MNIGERIKEFRTNKKISQEKLAWSANITPAYLGQIERGLKSPTVTILSRIASALNISLPELFSGPVELGADKAAALHQIQFQLSDLSPEDLKYISEIIENIKNIKNNTAK